MAVSILGNNISKAFTGGLPVKSIYSLGQKVWPTDLPDGYRRIASICSQPKRSNYDEVPFIEIFDLPMDKGDLIVEADFQIRVGSIPNEMLFFRTFDGDTIINRARTNAQTGYIFFLDRWAKSNTGAHFELNYYQRYTITQTITHDTFDTRTWINGTEYIDTTGYDKTHRTNTSFGISILGGKLYSAADTIYCYHRLYGLKIKDQDGNILYDLVPAQRTEDGEFGLYDVVNNNFLEKHRPYSTHPDASVAPLLGFNS